MVKTTLEGYCSSLGSLKDECVTLIDQYLPMVWNLLESYVDNPNQTCTQMKLCSSASRAAITKLVLLPWQHPLKKMPEETMCDLCKMVAGYLKPLVDSNTTEVSDEITFVLILCGISLVP